MIPVQVLEFLSFWLDSVNMTVKLTNRKVHKILHHAPRSRQTHDSTISTSHLQPGCHGAQGAYRTDVL